MGLTGSGFLALCVAFGLVVIGIALWALTRISGRGPGPLLARLGVLVAAQLAAISMVAVAVNDNFQFYTSMSDVMGTANNADNVVVKVSTPSHPSRVERASRESRTTPFRFTRGSFRRRRPGRPVRSSTSRFVAPSRD